jgi:hypothetical protein
MLLFKKPIYLGLLVLLVAGSGIIGWLFFQHGNLPVVEESTSTLKPEQIQEITEQKELAKKMLTSALTRLKDGVVSAVILREGDNGKLKLAINHSDKMLSELCKTQETCVGGIYASVHNNKDKGEIFHRIHKGKTLLMACVWLESYPSKFGPMDEALQKEVIGRAWHWVKKCFEE